MSIIFNGRAFAREKEIEVEKRVKTLKEKGIISCLASILIGDDPASKLYVGLKKKAAERVGIRLEVFDSVDEIGRLNRDKNVHGIVIQLLLPDAILNSKLQILNSIKPEKDVDGLRKDSPFVHPTAMAVLQVIEIAKSLLTVHRSPFTICVVGKTGMVGSALLREIRNTDYKLVEKSEDADILVSATGSPNIIKANMVKKGAIVIDVGSPKGDIDPSCYEVAGFVTPVPGGIGPITISCLLENLIVSAGKVS